MSLFDTPDGDGEAWGFAASQLGLRLHEPGHFVSNGETTAAEHARTLGPPAMGPPDTRHWMVGRRGGVDVLVLREATSVNGTQLLSTHVLASMTPPALLEFELSPIPQTSWLFQHGPATPTEWFWQRYVLAAPDPRIHAVFGELALTGFYHPFDFGGLGVAVYNSLVSTPSYGVVTDARTLAVQLDRVSWIAGFLSPRLHLLHDTWFHLDTAARWRKFADAHQLVFDADRRFVEGAIGALRMRLGLEAPRGGFVTTLTVYLPRALGVGLVFRKQLPDFLHLWEHRSPTRIEKLVFFQSDELFLGDPPFDNAFLIKAADPERAQGLFASPLLRQALLELTKNAELFMMDDIHLFIQWPVAIADDPTLEAVAAHLQTIQAALFPAAPQAPYR